LNTNGSGSGEVGTYTNTLTGPNAAELVRQPALPTQAAEASVTELTFTNAYDATFSNNSGARGSFSIATAEQSVPPTLDGVQLFAEDSTTFGNISWTNIFGSSTFQERDSDRSNSFGIYTFTPFTPVAALVVLTYTNPPALDGVAEYLILSFTEGASPAAGQFYYQSVIPLAETASSFGSFKLSTNAVANKFAGPPTLAGLQAKVVPAGEPASFAYTTSFGLGTFAALYIPPAANPSMITNGPNEAGLCLSNPRVATDAGAATLLPMAPPTATNVDESFGLFWESATSALWTNSSSGKTSALTFSPAPYDVPAALTGQTITVTPTGSKIAQTVAFTYNTYTNNDGDAGTYTYAPYSPTMALVRLNSTNAAEGKLGQMLVNYETGAYVSSTTNSLGEWTMKSGVFKTK
jgi:hypothetical protein